MLLTHEKNHLINSYHNVVLNILNNTQSPVNLTQTLIPSHCNYPNTGKPAPTNRVQSPRIITGFILVSKYSIKPTYKNSSPIIFHLYTPDEQSRTSRHSRRRAFAFLSVGSILRARLAQKIHLDSLMLGFYDLLGGGAAAVLFSGGEIGIPTMKLLNCHYYARDRSLPRASRRPFTKVALVNTAGWLWWCLSVCRTEKMI